MADVLSIINAEFAEPKIGLDMQEPTDTEVDITLQLIMVSVTLTTVENQSEGLG